MVVGSSIHSRRSASPEHMDDGYAFEATSPNASDEYSSDESSNSASGAVPRTATAERPPTTFPTSAKPSHPYRQQLASSSRPLRPRGMGLTPLASATNTPPLGTGALPKAQPLARALFARKANDSPHAGLGLGKKKGASTKMIVPTKGFRTTFELDLTASELARR